MKKRFKNIRDVSLHGKLSGSEFELEVVNGVCTDKQSRRRIADGDFVEVKKVADKPAAKSSDSKE